MSTTIATGDNTFTPGFTSKPALNLRDRIRRKFAKLKGKKIKTDMVLATCYDRGQPMTLGRALVERYAFQFTGPRTGQTRTVPTKSDIPKSVLQSGAYQEVHANDSEKRVKESTDYKHIRHKGQRVDSHEAVQKIHDRLQSMKWETLRHYAYGLDVKGRSREQIAEKVRALLLLKATEKAGKKEKEKGEEKPRAEEKTPEVERLSMGNWSVPVVSHDQLKPGHDAVFSYKGATPQQKMVERINPTTIKFRGTKPLPKSDLKVGISSQDEESRIDNLKTAKAFDDTANRLKKQSIAEANAKPLAEYTEMSDKVRRYKLKPVNVNGQTLYKVAFDRDGEEVEYSQEPLTKRGAMKELSEHLHGLSKRGDVKVHDEALKSHTSAIKATEDQGKEKERQAQASEDERRAAASNQRVDVHQYLDAMKMPKFTKAPAPWGGEGATGHGLGQFVVHKRQGVTPDRGYSIVHAPTGLGAGFGRTLDQAKRHAAVMHQHANWDFTDPKAIPADAAKIGRALNKSHSGDYSALHEILIGSKERPKETPKQPSATPRPSVDPSAGSSRMISLRKEAEKAAPVAKPAAPKAPREKMLTLAQKAKAARKEREAAAKAAAPAGKDPLQVQPAATVKNSLTVPAPSKLPGLQSAIASAGRSPSSTNVDTIRGKLAEIAARKNAAVTPKSYADEVYKGVTPQEMAADGGQRVWALRDKATGKLMMETRQASVVNKLNRDMYEAVPMIHHLKGLNKPAPSPAAAQATHDRLREKIYQRTLSHVPTMTRPQFDDVWNRHRDSLTLGEGILHLPAEVARKFKAENPGAEVRDLPDEVTPESQAAQVRKAMAGKDPWGRDRKGATFSVGGKSFPVAFNADGSGKVTMHGESKVVTYRGNQGYVVHGGRTHPFVIRNDKEVYDPQGHLNHPEVIQARNAHKRAKDAYDAAKTAKAKRDAADNVEFASSKLSSVTNPAPGNPYRREYLQGLIERGVEVPEDVLASHKAEMAKVQAATQRGGASQQYARLARPETYATRLVRAFQCR